MSMFKWEYRFGGHGECGASRLYRCDDAKVQMEVHTKRSIKTGKWGKGRAYFYIDGDERTFRTEADLIKAWKEKK